MHRLLDDLYELQAFLAQREGELASSAGETLSAVAPEAVQVPVDTKTPCRYMLLVTFRYWNRVVDNRIVPSAMKSACRQRAVLSQDQAATQDA